MTSLSEPHTGVLLEDDSSSGSFLIVPTLCPPTRNGGKPSRQHAMVVNSKGPAMQAGYVHLYTAKGRERKGEDLLSKRNN